MSGSSILNGVGRIAYQLAYQISPIMFQNGIAGSLGGVLPIVLITETGYSFSGSPDIASLVGTTLTTAVNLTGSNPSDLDQFFAHFSPVAGSKLASFQIGQFPFANQAVAANAIIAEPLNVSIRMIVPVNKPGGHTTKLVTMTALQSAIQQHAAMGGTYIVATPAYIYTSCILLDLTDVSSGESPIPSNTWQWNFSVPLVSLAAAQAAQNSLMNNISNGLPTSGASLSTASNSGVPNIVTSNPVGQGIAPTQSLIPPSVSAATTPSPNFMP